MVEHIVLLKLKDGVTESQTRELLAGLNKLRSVMPGILDVSGGYNSSPEGKSSGFTYGFMVRFSDMAARDEYLSHPEHQKLAQNLVRPIVDDVLVFDYEH